MAYGRWIGALAIALGSGCGTGPGDRLAQLAEARRIWDGQAITSYLVTIKRVCFCSEVRSVRVTVANRQVVSRAFVDDGQPVPAVLIQAYPSIDGLFDLLEDAARRADEIHLTFDPTIGIPLQANIDFVKNAVDDEVNFIVSDFSRQ